MLAFVASDVSVYAQSVLTLPSPGVRISLSPRLTPPLLKGIKVYANDPFRFDFILDNGDVSPHVGTLRATSLQLAPDTKATQGIHRMPYHHDASRLIKYFLAALTIPEKDMWVNLSPYERNRIVPKAFGQTEMGRDLLAQDYILKQITASLMYPEGDVGKKFWTKVYAALQDKYGTTDIPVDTLNKVWIVPEKATVFENNDAAYVVESRLKVMLETDYLTRVETLRATSLHNDSPGELTKNILREVIIPLLEKEVNEGSHFAQLRQIYNSLILATWYKRKVMNALPTRGHSAPLQDQQRGSVSPSPLPAELALNTKATQGANRTPNSPWTYYIDHQKITGVDIADKNEKERIWAQYVTAFKKGAFNYIHDVVGTLRATSLQHDLNTPRQYFSGGASLNQIANVFHATHNISSFTSNLASDNAMRVEMRANPMDRSQNNAPMLTYKLAQGATLLTTRAVRAENILDQVHIENGPNGTFVLGRNEWPVEKSSLESINKVLPLLPRLARLIQERKDNNTPINIIDWGAGKGTALHELDQWLKTKNIPNVHLIGFSDVLYPEWNELSDGVTMIWTTAENLMPILERNNINTIDLIYSHYGLWHLAFEKERHRTHLKTLINRMSARGQILSHPVDAIPQHFKRQTSPRNKNTHYIEWRAQKNLPSINTIDNASLDQSQDNAADTLTHTLKNGATLLTAHPADTNDINSTAMQLKVNEDTYGQFMFESSSYTIEDSHLNTVDAAINLIRNLEILLAKRKDDAPVVIMDWGAGKGTTLKELNLWLKENSVKNVRLIGFSNIFYPEWRTLPDDITMIWATPKHLLPILKKNKIDEIDLIYSHYGLSHLDIQDETQTTHTKALLDKMSAHGRILSYPAQLPSRLYSIFKRELNNSNDFYSMWINQQKTPSIPAIDNAQTPANIKSEDNAQKAPRIAPYVLLLQKAWKLKLEESRHYWKTDLRFDFPYNHRAPSIAYDPQLIKQRTIGPFVQISYSELPERDDFDFIPEDVSADQAKTGLERELKNAIMTDPLNNNLILAPARWPLSAYHLIVMTKDQHPQLEKTDYLLSALTWAQKGLAVEYHQRFLNKVNHYHLQLYDPTDLPITKYTETFQSLAQENEVTLGQLTAYPAPHLALASSNLEKLASITMLMHRKLESLAVPFTRDIVRDKNGKLIVLFFIFSGKPGGFRFNTLGQVRSDNFSMTTEEVFNGLKLMFEPPEKQMALAKEIWQQWTSATVGDSTRKDKNILQHEDNENINAGGIDLNPDRMGLTTQSNDQGIPFNIDAAQFKRMRAATGITPVIINIEPLGSLTQFLGTT
ncbi:MAG: hypothetical protein V2A70_04130 [Candidatus Omnitrophota bacterium]